jgi:hypothetical protein
MSFDPTETIEELRSALAMLAADLREICTELASEASSAAYADGKQYNG